MGKDRISSQEIADYTNINATQIRRDLSNFGKFGKRGVGYSIDGLLGEIRKILRTQGQHNIALVGRRPARPGDRGLADLRRARHHDRGGVRRRRAGRRALDRRDRGEPVRAAEGRRARQEHRRRRPRRPRRPPPSRSPTISSTRACGSSSTTPRRFSTAARRHRAHLEPCGRAPSRPVLPPHLGADPPLARVPPGRNGLERLHARARAGVESRRARGDGGLPGAGAGAVRPRGSAGRAAGAAGRSPAGVRARPLRGPRAAAAPGLHAGGAPAATSTRTSPRCRSCCPPTSSSRITS